MSAVPDVDTARVERALQVLDEILGDPNASRADRLSAARAVLSRDGRESANIPTRPERGSDVVKW